MTDSGQSNSKRVALRWQAFINANANYVNYPCYCPLGRNSTVTQPVTSIQRSPPSLSIRSPLASVVIYNIPITSGDSVQILFSWNESEVPQCRPMCVSWGVRVREWWDNVMDTGKYKGVMMRGDWGNIGVWISEVSAETSTLRGNRAIYGLLREDIEGKLREQWGVVIEGSVRIRIIYFNLTTTLQWYKLIKRL